ncbi:MAG: oxygen-independent coproporphyrinogen III oxidase [Alphaproteobacteria bacterium]|nr:oxygen-independent coproporphyrinogen III oxidase [Alphaproteobacteria bacterium]
MICIKESGAFIGDSGAMRADLITKYDVRVPRYTSYPTAPHFGPEVESTCYRRWMSDLDPGEPLSLYLHVPFCHELCWFCGCHTTATRRDRPVAAYAARLAREIDICADSLARRARVTHVHWGGGTPTRLACADFSRIMERLRDRFAVAADGEIAVEIDPRQFTPAMARTLADAGVTRASLGVQDFDPNVQTAIGRVQSLEVTESAVEELRAVGITALNLDLMYGLPGQTVASLEHTVDSAIALAPNRLALFGYAHLPDLKRHQRLIDGSRLPDAAARIAQFEAASARILGHGYRPVGLDHFARPDDDLIVALDQGRLRRNFQGYTADRAEILLGIGASAISRLPQGYAQNAVHVRDWSTAIDAGQLPAARGIAIDDDDRLRGRIIERLMCELDVDVAEQCHALGMDPNTLADAFKALAPLAADGLVRLDGWRVTVPVAARPFRRLACAAVDRAGGPQNGPPIEAARASRAAPAL